MPLRFRKVLIADERYESAGVFDVDNDGVLDIVSGAYWYKGPDFKQAFPVGPVAAFGEYFDDFSTIPLDVDGDGYTDFITGGFWGNNIRWRKNPGPAGGDWVEHEIDQTGSVETTRAWDIDGCGTVEIVPNAVFAPLSFYKLVKDANGKGTGKFIKTTVTAEGEGQGHGLGWGDITGRGHGDFILSKGWVEAPADGDLMNGKWTWHPDFDLGSASVPILVADVNGDGLNDLIVGAAHQKYGLWWYEQRITNGKREWIQHPIDPFNAGYHDMQWVDIDGDGKCELVTGKRYRAHCGADAGETDDNGLYYFKWNGESFTKQVIDYGPARVGKGTGIFFITVDLTGNGLLDIVAPGKDGLYVFYNEGLTGQM